MSEYLKNPKAKGIVLDLRNDPGGYMQAKMWLATLFQPKVAVIRKGDGKRTEYKVERYENSLKFQL